MKKAEIRKRKRLVKCVLKKETGISKEWSYILELVESTGYN